MRAVYRQEMNKINVALDGPSSHSTQDDFAGHLLAAGCPPLGISTGVEPMKLCARIAGSARRESSTCTQTESEASDKPWWVKLNLYDIQLYLLFIQLQMTFTER